MIIALFIISTTNGMEKQVISREPREWDAQAYEDGSKMPTESCFYFITKNNINTLNKTILSAGCGTGKIESILANVAKRIHGFDASKNMINFAHNKYGLTENLSFEYCFAEDFKSQKLHQLAIASHAIHWFDGKKQALQRISDNLELHGELFGTMSTSNNQLPVNVRVFAEMLSSLDWLREIIGNKSLQDITDVSYVSHQELEDMLHETNFEIIVCEEQDFPYTMANKDDVRKLYWPLISSRPMAKQMSKELLDKFFNEFIDRIIEKLQTDEDGFIKDTLYTTVIHARKIKK